MTEVVAQPHHDGSALYVEPVSPLLGQRVTVRLRVPATPDWADVTDVHVRQVRDGDPFFTEAVRKPDTDGLESWWTAVIVARNPLTPYRWLLNTPTGQVWLSAGGLTTIYADDSRDFVLTTHPAPPAWALDSIVYQIFPDRFHDSGTRTEPLPTWALPARWTDPMLVNVEGSLEQIYGGDLPGVAAKLDHLERVGANVAYLTPFFPSRSNHRYDASSFEHPDPVLGGAQGLRALTTAAHDRGMRVMGDLTLNHCGSSHPWFVAAQGDPTSEERGFFYFDEDGRYDAFYDVASLPKFNHAAPELARRLYSGAGSVAARYLTPDYGLDGWRIDVAEAAGRRGADDFNRQIATDTRATMAAANPETLLIAEHQFDASADLDGSGWHGTMDYAGFTRPVWSWLARRRDVREFWGVPGPIPAYDAAEMVATMTALHSRVPWSIATHNLTLLDSHDTARLRSFTDDDRMTAAAGLLFLLPGLPMIYAGDEVGVLGDGLEDGRKPFPWDEPAWNQRALADYTTLGRLRREHHALRRGGLRWLYAEGDVVLFERQSREQRLLVQISRDTHEPLTSPVDGEPLLSGPAARYGEPLPGAGPAVHVWQIR